MRLNRRKLRPVNVEFRNIFCDVYVAKLDAWKERYQDVFRYYCKPVIGDSERMFRESGQSDREVESE